jgi:hypothetical protein
VDATDPNPHVSARPCKTGAETPHPLARGASGLDWRLRQSRTPIHFTERLSKKAPSRAPMDFGPHLWLSCNKLAPGPASSQESERKRPSPATKLNARSGSRGAASIRNSTRRVCFRPSSSTRKPAKC